MRVVKPESIEICKQNPQKHIEAIGRICYKSEDRITEESHKKFIGDMYSRNHLAMLEHFRFIIRVPHTVYQSVIEVGSQYINHTMTFTGYEEGIIYDHKRYRAIISMSARGLIDAIKRVESEISMRATDKNYRGRDLTKAHLDDLTRIASHLIWYHGCNELFGNIYNPESQPFEVINNEYLSDRAVYTEEEMMVHGWHSVKFTCDRGVTHEFVRHRQASFAQESTRYCNYGKDKFGGQISFIKPSFFNDTERYGLWARSMEHCEKMYMRLLESGATPQEARAVLPHSVKSDIVITATNAEWAHIIDLRYIGSTGRPHPQIIEVMGILIRDYEWAHNLWLHSTHRVVNRDAVR